ncbi:MAG: hypothetical protein PHP45_00440 [Elusimicrobiales bacterium]|nr:hypothetical protein [Elusimicrobiales bacterium]
MGGNDIPELNIPRFKKEEPKERKGFLPWIFGGARTGASVPTLATGGSGGWFGFLSGVMAGSRGLGAFITGKLGLLVSTAVITAVAAGVGLVISKSIEGPKLSSSSSAPYVPLAERSGAAASSLEMVSDTNRGKVVGFTDEEAFKKAAELKARAAEEAAKQRAGQDDGQVQTSATGDAGAMLPAIGGLSSRLAGGSIGQLSSQLGGKFGGAPGNFSNKFASGEYGAKGVGFGGVMGSFQKPVFNKPGNLAALASARKINVNARTAAKFGTGRGSFGQALGIRTQLAANRGVTKVDTMRSNTDQAWQGQTMSGGVSASAGGVDSGDGSGVVSSPSLDNTNVPTSGGEVDTSSPDAGTASDATPWAKLTALAQLLLLIANILVMVVGLLSTIAKKLMQNPMTAAIGAMVMAIAVMVAGIAAALGAAVSAIGNMLKSTYGQSIAGTGLMTSGAITMGAAFAALGGGAIALMASVMAAISSGVSMLSSMMSMPSQPKPSLSDGTGTSTGTTSVSVS